MYNLNFVVVGKDYRREFVKIKAWTNDFVADESSMIILKKSETRKWVGWLIAVVTDVGGTDNDEYF